MTNKKRKLTAPQIAWLRDLAAGRNPSERVHCAQGRGHQGQTFMALVRKGLVGEITCSLTQAGRDALKVLDGA